MFIHMMFQFKMELPHITISYYRILPYITIYYHILPYIHPLKWISRPGPCLVPGTKPATSLGKSQQLCGIGRPPKSTNASEIPGLGWESIKHGIVIRRSWRFNEIYVLFFHGYVLGLRKNNQHEDLGLYIIMKNCVCWGLTINWPSW